MARVELHIENDPEEIHIEVTNPKGLDHAIARLQGYMNVHFAHVIKVVHDMDRTIKEMGVEPE